MDRDHFSNLSLPQQIVSWSGTLIVYVQWFPAVIRAYIDKSGIRSSAYTSIARTPMPSFTMADSNSF